MVFPDTPNWTLDRAAGFRDAERCGPSLQISRSASTTHNPSNGIPSQFEFFGTTLSTHSPEDASVPSVVPKTRRYSSVACDVGLIMITGHRDSVATRWTTPVSKSQEAVDGWGDPRMTRSCAIEPASRRIMAAGSPSRTRRTGWTTWADRSGNSTDKSLRAAARANSCSRSFIPAVFRTCSSVSCEWFNSVKALATPASNKLST